MTALGHHLHRLSGRIDRFHRGQDRGGRLEGHPAHHRLTGRNAARRSARVVGKVDWFAVFPGAHPVGIFLAGQARRLEAVADFHALDRVDAHHRGGEVAVELGIDRRAPACGDAGGDAFDDRAERGTGLARGIDLFFPALGGGRIGAEERVVGDFGIVDVRRVDPVAAQLADIGGDRHLGDHQPRHRARCHPRRCLARTGTPAATIVANAVFGVIGVVGMARAILLGDRGIVLAPLVGVLDHQADRRAGGLALEGAAENPHQIILAPLGGEAAGARLAGVHEGLDELFGDGEARRAPVDNRAQCGPVALSPGGKAQHAPEGVPAHGASIT